MRVVGFDPGLRITGFGVIEQNGKGLEVISAGVIRVSEKQDLSLRLKEIYFGVKQVLEESHCDQVAVEELYSHYKHPRTAILMGHARGMIFLAAAESGLPVTSYSARRIKQILTGTGSAQKMQVQRSIQAQLSLLKLPEPADVADALAVALCHINRSRKELRGR
jgi:crossover junction endodeoxyribonuclease RuvC